MEFRYRRSQDVRTAGQTLLITLTSCTLEMLAGEKRSRIFLPLSNKRTVHSLCRSCLPPARCFDLRGSGHEGACSEEVFALLGEGAVQ